MSFPGRPSAAVFLCLSLPVQSVVFVEGDLDRSGILEPVWFVGRGFVEDLG